MCTRSWRVCVKQLSSFFVTHFSSDTDKKKKKKTFQAESYLGDKDKDKAVGLLSTDTDVRWAMRNGIVKSQTTLLRPEVRRLYIAFSGATEMQRRTHTHLPLWLSAQHMAANNW